MAEANTITADFARTILDYDPDTGILRWKARTPEEYGSEQYCRAWNTKYAGRVAGAPHSKGYLAVTINGRTYKAHRLIWLIVTGDWPPVVIDHINHNRSDNRIDNLRAATSVENAHNRADPDYGKGYCFNKRKQRWKAYEVKSRGAASRKFIGYFATSSEAQAAALKAQAK